MEPNVTTTQTSTGTARPRFGAADNLSHLPFRNPFVGLRHFESNESLLFFGRSEQTVDLLQQLHRTRLLAVVGSSGCGKSSLIRAGLIPKLKAGFLVEDRDVWLTATMKPGTDPIGNLAESLVGELSSQQNGSAESLAKQIRTGGTQAILDYVKPALANSDANLLLLADQFEEVFSAGDEAADFISMLLALAEQTALPIYVVLTMRSDFWDRCEEFYGLPEAMNRSLYMVPRLTRQQRQQAIEGPIRLFGGSLTARLLDRVLNDAGDQSDQLPVMQHALMRTWDEWRNPSAEHQAKHSGEAIDVCCYEAVGTIKDALSRDAEAALAGMTDKELKITERVFQALTDTDDNNRRVRRPTHLSELCEITGADRNTIKAIIERLSGGGRSFLTITNEDYPLIDISHESLIRQWKRVEDWVKTESDWRDRYKRLSHAAEIYFLGRNKYDDLLKGSQLTLALEWREKRKPNHIWALRYHPNTEPIESKRLFDLTIAYLATSERAFLLESKEERKEKERRKQTRWWTLLVVIIFCISFLTFLASLAYQVVSLMEKTSRQNIYQRDMSRADEELPFKILKGHEESVNSVAFSPDGKMLASASEDKTVKLWDIQSGQTIATLTEHEGAVLSVSFAPSGNLFASASSDQTVKLWDIKTRQLISTFSEHQAPVLSVAFAPDGKMLASGSEDKTVKLWDIQSGKTIATFTGHESRVSSVAFSPDSQTLASASFDQTVRLWDIQTLQSMPSYNGHKASVLSVAFAPDGKTLASTGYDKTIMLWDTQLGHTVAISGHLERVLSVAFAPNGKTLASASEDTTVGLWDTQSGQQIGRRIGHEDLVKSVAFAPDGKMLASAGGDINGKKDFAIRLWRAATDADVARQRNK